MSPPDPLDRYRAKRDFTRTAEPAPGQGPVGGAPIFVVQKHAARRLHYDFRLEHDGVLWSWAVPKGPSMDTADKRLAVHVEDHPLDYAQFEGTIPEGNYGAGSVEIWDRGIWAPVGDAAADLARGELKLTLSGVRLQGRFVLIRLKPRPKEHAENWLLIKEHDAHEQPGVGVDQLESISLASSVAPVAPQAVAPPAPNAPVRKTLARRAPARAGVVVHAPKPKPAAAEVAGVSVSHPDRQLWPGLTKLDLAQYWQAILPWAETAVAHRPLALVRCPDGVGGSQQFFQKHAMPGQQPAVHAAEFEGHPYLSVDDRAGFAALAQMAAIELHSWGSSVADPGRPDRIVLDLDPGDDVAWPDVVAAAHDVRGRLTALGLESFCRTTGGKGLHVVVPLTPLDGWDVVKPWCQAFAQLMERDRPDSYVSTLPKVKRRGKILVDWLRNGVGATAIASFSPRARPGATVATPVAWAEVTDRLGPAGFTIETVPARLAKLKRDPWQGFAGVGQTLPQPSAPVRPVAAAGRAPGRVVRAKAPSKVARTHTAREP